MLSTLLIPGYAVGLRASIFRQPFGEHAGFVGVEKEVKDEKVKVFRWGKSFDLSILECVNPWRYFQLYRDEEALAESVETQSVLSAIITENESSTIICHSLGCRLMIGMMNNTGLPSCVSKIVLLQGDAPTSVRIENTEIKHRLIDESLVIENYYCSWDQSLLASLLVHRISRIGLTGWSEPGVKNIFYPLLKPVNLHTSPLRDGEFLREIISM